MKKIYYLFGGLIAIPLLFFILNFKSQYISSNNTDWANFSTYLAGFVSLANLIVFILLTEELHLYNKKKDDQMSKAEKPIISFKRKGGDNNKYFAENVGKGTALNVIINGSLGDESWNESYIYYSFSANTEKEVCVKHNNALLAKYEDIYGNKYVSYMDCDELRYFEIEIEKKEKKYSLEFERAKYKSVKPTWIV